MKPSVALLSNKHVEKSVQSDEILCWRYCFCKCMDDGGGIFEICGRSGEVLISKGSRAGAGDFTTVTKIIASCVRLLRHNQSSYSAFPCILQFFVFLNLVSMISFPETENYPSVFNEYWKLGHKGKIFNLSFSVSMTVKNDFSFKEILLTIVFDSLLFQWIWFKHLLSYFMNKKCITNLFHIAFYIWNH